RFKACLDDPPRHPVPAGRPTGKGFDRIHTRFVIPDQKSFGPAAVFPGRRDTYIGCTRNDIDVVAVHST
ncbi:hypothetical protein, partial [Ralstonia pickettii]|uniref:hypothetical protein n=1 Tax=Ralstonia pickettii TaxID=329 RepID=UPI001C71E1A9